MASNESKSSSNRKDSSKTKAADSKSDNNSRQHAVHQLDSKIIQSSIENILKQKVFLESTTEVHKLGKDMMKLRKLLNQAASAVDVYNHTCSLKFKS
jgi:hypothetical protein